MDTSWSCISTVLSIFLFNLHNNPCNIHAISLLSFMEEVTIAQISSRNLTKATWLRRAFLGTQVTLQSRGDVVALCRNIPCALKLLWHLDESNDQEKEVCIWVKANETLWQRQQEPWSPSVTAGICFAQLISQRHEFWGFPSPDRTCGEWRWLW